MKKIVLLSFLIAFSLLIQAQILRPSPQFPIDTDSVYIYFNAEEGNQGLMNYSGDVYAHTGVITGASSSLSDWKYVKTDWAENTAETKLERISANVYLLKIKPSIRAYYGVPISEKILKMAFVFRSSDAKLEAKTESGGDIFYDVYEPGLNILINSPNASKIIYKINESVSVDVASNYADSMQIYLNNLLLVNTTDSIYNATFTADVAGDYKLVAKAFADGEMVADSVSYFVMTATPVVAELPAGMKKGVNIINNNTVTLVLYAPYKDYVFAIGDFNNWMPSSDFLMNKTPDGTTYWITISNLETQKEYIYQFLINGDLKVADPYTEKVSDPWNDKWIPTATYPNLIAYPEGKTTEIASVFQIQQDVYTWEVNNFDAPANQDLVIYELHLRDFTSGGDFSSAMLKLDYLQALGINAIELMPVSEFEGNDSWGYNPSFYFAVDKAYGTKNIYKKFIDECHKRGIAVIQDIVLNHSYSQSPLVRMYWNGSSVTSLNPWYNVTSPNPVYSWGYDFNHESNATVEFMDSVLQFWLHEFKIDGYRLDFVKGLTNTPGDGGAYDADRIAITTHYYEAAKEINPDVYFILELFADNAEESQLADAGMMIWGNMNYAYSEGAMGYNENGKSDFSRISHLKRGWSKPNLVGYAESHDEERVMFKVLKYGDDYLANNLWLALPRAELTAAFLLTVPGPKMIWQFGELGYDYSIEYNGRVGRKPVKWEYYDDNSRRHLYDVYAAINKLRKENDVFSTNDFELSVSGAAKIVKLRSANMNVMLIGNYSIDNQSIKSSFPATGTWYDYMSGTSISVASPEHTLELLGGEYKIYTDVQLETPDITTGVEELQGSLRFLVYPNPANGCMYIDYTSTDISEIRIFALDGTQKNIQVQYEYARAAINTSVLNSGIYVAQIVHSNGIYSVKFMIE